MYSRFFIRNAILIFFLFSTPNFVTSAHHQCHTCGSSLATDLDKKFLINEFALLGLMIGIQSSFKLLRTLHSTIPQMPLKFFFNLKKLNVPAAYKITNYSWEKSSSIPASTIDDDISFVKNLINQEENNLDPDSVKRFNEYEKEDNKKDFKACLSLIKKNDENIGFAFYRHTQQEVCILLLAIKAEHKRQGAGKALIGHILSQLKNNDKDALFKTLELEAPEDNNVANVFFNKIGFPYLSDVRPKKILYDIPLTTWSKIYYFFYYALFGRSPWVRF